MTLSLANSTSLHPVQAILGIIIFGRLFGSVGIILAVPAFVSGKIMLDNIHAGITSASPKATPWPHISSCYGVHRLQGCSGGRRSGVEHQQQALEVPQRSGVPGSCRAGNR